MTPHANLNCSELCPPIPPTPKAENTEAQKITLRQTRRALWSGLIAFGVPLLTLVFASIVIAVAPTPEIRELLGRQEPVTKASRLAADQEEIKAAYASMTLARQEMDAEGLLHFISATTPLTAKEFSESYPDAIRRAFEKGQAIAPFFVEAREASTLVGMEPVRLDDADGMLVTFQVDAGSVVRTYVDTWAKEQGQWKFKRSDVTGEVKTVDEAAKIRQAYRAIEQASSEQAAQTFAAYLSPHYVYVTKTGVRIDATEVRESIRQFVKRRRWSDRISTLGSSEQLDDGRKYVVSRSVRVPLSDGKEALTLYQDVWELEGTAWKLTQTAVEQQETK